MWLTTSAAAARPTQWVWPSALPYEARHAHLVLDPRNEEPDRQGVEAVEALDQERQRLPFHLLSDSDGALRKAFGVPRTLGLFPGRVTYVIDKQGVVRHVFSSRLQPTRHVAEALAIVRGLAA